MKNCILVGLGIFGCISSSFGAAVFSENFNSYSDGPLTNQGPWLATANAAIPITVASGRANLLTGQDAYAAFGAPVTATDGTSLYSGLTLNVASATGGGDYFFHLSNPAGTTSSFYERLFVRSSTGGFQLGLVDTSGTGSLTTWGVTEFSLNTDYRVVVALNFIAGLNNDTFAVYVDPTDPSVEGNNTAYLTHTWTSVTLEPTAYAAVNLRQGGATTAPGVLVDDIVLGTAFSDVTQVQVPEPSSMALTVLGTLALLGSLKRRK